MQPGSAVEARPSSSSRSSLLEEGNSLRWHCDSGSCFWIAPDAPSSLPGVEASEAADFNLVSGSQGTNDAVKYGADGGLGFLHGQPSGSVNLFGQIGPDHLAHPRRNTKKSITAQTQPQRRCRHAHCETDRHLSPLNSVNRSRNSRSASAGNSGSLISNATTGSVLLTSASSPARTLGRRTARFGSPFHSGTRR